VRTIATFFRSEAIIVYGPINSQPGGYTCRSMGWKPPPFRQTCSAGFASLIGLDAVGGNSRSRMKAGNIRHAINSRFLRLGLGTAVDSLIKVYVNRPDWLERFSEQRVRSRLSSVARMRLSPSWVRSSNCQLHQDTFVRFSFGDSYLMLLHSGSRSAGVNPHSRKRDAPDGPQ
jgi:hypothetical protein